MGSDTRNRAKYMRIRPNESANGVYGNQEFASCMENGMLGAVISVETVND